MTDTLYIQVNLSIRLGRSVNLALRSKPKIKVPFHLYYSLYYVIALLRFL